MASKSKYGSESAAFNKALKRDRRLRRKREQEMQGGGTVNKLCTPRSPCQLLSCNRCRVRAQEKFILEFLPIAARQQDEGIAADHTMQTITIIPSFGRFSREQLAEANLSEITKKVHRILRKHAPGAKALLWMDVSLNFGSEVEEHWQIHYHGVVVGLSAGQKKALAKTLRKGTEESRKYPLLVEEIYNLQGWLEYISKPTFVSRETAQLRYGTTTQKTQLSVSEENELASWLCGNRTDQRQSQLGKGNRC